MCGGTVFPQSSDQCFSCRRRVARHSRRECRPAVEQAVAVNENPDKCHDLILPGWWGSGKRRRAEAIPLASVGFPASFFPSWWDGQSPGDDGLEQTGKDLPGRVSVAVG